MFRPQYALWISLLAATSFLGCGESSVSGNPADDLSAPVIAGAPDAATLEANYTADFDAETIRQDLALIAWAGKYESEVEALIDADEPEASKCQIDDSDAQAEGNHSQLTRATRWTKADGTRLTVCPGDYASVEEYFGIMHGGHNMLSLVGTSDSLDVTMETSTDMIKGGSGNNVFLNMDITGSALYDYQYPQPISVMMKFQWVQQIDAKGGSSKISSYTKYWFMSGRYQCAANKSSDSEVDTKICDITHGDKVVGTLWSEGGEDDVQYILDIDGSRIEPAN